MYLIFFKIICRFGDINGVMDKNKTGVARKENYF